MLGRATVEVNATGRVGRAAGPKPTVMATGLAAPPHENGAPCAFTHPSGVLPWERGRRRLWYARIAVEVGIAIAAFPGAGHLASRAGPHPGTAQGAEPSGLGCTAPPGQRPWTTWSPS